MTSTPIPYHDAAREISLTVLQELAPEEVEVALGFLDPLIEMAAEDELVRVDSGDHSGGFGNTDALFVTVVPMVVEALRALGMEHTTGSRPSASQVESVLQQRSLQLGEIIHRVGSPRAAEAAKDLRQVLLSATRRYLEPA